MSLPQAWFRNEWSWKADSKKPSLKDQGNGVVLAEHAELGRLNSTLQSAGSVAVL